MEATRGRRKSHNEELRNSYCSSDIVRESTSRRMRWAGHVTRMAEMSNAYMFRKRELKIQLRRRIHGVLLF
jgi:hypothetical protein